MPRVRPLTVALVALALLVVGFGLYLGVARYLIAQRGGQVFAATLLSFEQNNRHATVCTPGPNALWCMPTRNDMGVDTYWVTAEILITPICVLEQTDTQAKVLAAAERTGYAITPSGKMFHGQIASSGNQYYTLVKTGDTWQVSMTSAWISNLDNVLCAK